MDAMDLEELKRCLSKHLEIKDFAFHATRMEMEEDIDDFWYLCGKMVNTIQVFGFSLWNFQTPYSMAEICRKLHEGCMLDSNPGMWSIKDRTIGGRDCIPPKYINDYMKTFSFKFAREFTGKIVCNLAHTFLYIHPFLDGNGRVAKMLAAIIRGCFLCKIKTKEQHYEYCILLGELQKN